MIGLCSIISAFLGSFLTAVVAIPQVVRICQRHNLFDMPNARKVHSVAIPRLGGVVFMPTMLVGFVVGEIVLNGGLHESLELKMSSLGMAAGAFIIYIIGLLDDIREVKAIQKFVIQFIAALIFPFCNLIINDLHGLFGIYQIPFILSYPLTVFIILLVVNAMNLIDGIDGLSSSLAVFILVPLGYFFWQLKAINFCLIAFALAGSIIAFWIYNMFGKVGGNKVFMGDSGSLFVGYVIVYLIIKHQMSNDNVLPYRENSLLISYTLVIIPTFDVIRVAICRLYRHQGMFSPDKTHIHHKLMQTGLTMNQTLAIILLLFIIFSGMNYAMTVSCVNLTIIVAVDIILYCAFILTLEKFKNYKN